MLSLTRRALRRPKLTIAVWAAFTVVLATAGHGVEHRLSPTQITIGGTQSGRAQEMRDEAFGESVTFTVMLDGPSKAVVEQTKTLVRDLRTRKGVRVLSPLDRQPGWRALRPEKDVALLLVDVPRPASADIYELTPAFTRYVLGRIDQPVRASFSGEPVIGRALNAASVQATKKAEMIALPILVLVLLLVFGSPVAAAIPGVFGGAIVLSGLGVIRLLTAVMELDATATSLLSMMGLALGVDYSLLMVSRFREAVREGVPPGVAAADVTAITAGRTVLFAGAVLVTAMFAMLLLSPGTVLVSAAVGVMTIGLMSMIAAVLVVPAALVLLGPHIERWRIGGGNKAGHGRMLPALLRGARRRPGILALLSALFMLAVATPTLALKTGTSTVELLPNGDAARTDFDRITRRFGGGWAVPLEVMVRTERGSLTADVALKELAKFQGRLNKDPAIASVVGPAAVRGRLRGLDAAPKRLSEARKGTIESQRQLALFERKLGAADSSVRELINGLGTASTGAGHSDAVGDNAADGTRSLEDGAGAGRRGTDALVAGLRKAQRATRMLLEAAGRAGDGAGKVANATRGTASGLRRLESGIRRIRTEIANSAHPVAAELAIGLKNGAENLRRLRGPAGMTQDELRKAFAALRAMSIGKADPRYRAAMESTGKALAAFSGRDPLTGKPVHADYEGLPAALQEAEREGSKAGQSAQTLADGLGELKTQMSPIEGGAAELAKGATHLEDGAARLNRGLQALIARVRVGVDGTVRLVGGARRLSRGLGELEQGAGKLHNALGRLASGDKQLAGGLREGRAHASDLGLELAQGKRRLDGFRKRLDAQAGELDGRTLRQARDLLGSGYAALAAIDAAQPVDRAMAGLLIDVDHGGGTGRVLIVPRGAPNDPETRALKERVAAEAERLERRLPGEVAVGGTGAKVFDYNDVTSGRLPLLILGIAIASCFALVLVLRSLVLPLVAVLMNLLAVGAAFGAIAVAFQGDSPPLGGPGYVDVIAVSGMFAIIFGLSLDYQVFLLSRIRERLDETGDCQQAAEQGLLSTAGVVTGAAAIMTAVFIAFSTAPFVAIRQFGVGLAVAVALDATVVRLILLPAVLRLLGAHAWYLPAWLDRLLPRVNSTAPGPRSPTPAAASPPQAIVP